MNKDELKLKTLFDAPPHAQTKTKMASYIFIEQVILGLVPWVFVIGLSVTLGILLGGWWWSMLFVAIILSILGFFLVIGNSYYITQYYLYARTGITTQNILDTICAKDAGFEEFLINELTSLVKEKK